MATYSCAVGYSLENGDKDRLCQHDGVSVSGEWSGSAPVCVGKFLNVFILCMKSSEHFLWFQEPVLHWLISLVVQLCTQWILKRMVNTCLGRWLLLFVMRDLSCLESSHKCVRTTWPGPTVSQAVWVSEQSVTKFIREHINAMSQWVYVIVLSVCIISKMGHIVILIDCLFPTVSCLSESRGPWLWHSHLLFESQHPR